MDILLPVLVFGTVVSPLIAAAAIAGTSLFRPARNGRAERIAQLGAAATVCFAIGLLVVRIGHDGANESPLSLGSWFVNGPNDLLRVSFGLRFGALTALLTIALAIAAGVVFAANRTRDTESPAARWLPLGGSLLFFASIGVAASTNLAELFVFWEIGTAVAYVLSSLAAENAPQTVAAQQAVAARKLVLVLSVADAFLLCAVVILAAGMGTVDFRSLFGQPERWAQAAEQRAALVNLVGLCILGATVGRCGLVPFLGWIGDLSSRPARLAALIEAIALLPCGAVLWVRCFPLLNLAGAILPLAAFVGGSSAFCLGVCAIADANPRRAATYSCATVLAIALLGFSTGDAAAPAIMIGLMAVFVPSATAILIASSASVQTGAHRWLLMAMALLLFSGLCGQGWILGHALESLLFGAGGETPTLLLAVLLAGCGQYLAAVAMMRSLSTAQIHGELDSSHPYGGNPFEPFRTASVVETLGHAEAPVGWLLLLVTAAIGAAIVAVPLILGVLPPLPPHAFAYAALGLIPGVGGLAAGVQAARGGWKVFPSEAVNGLLTRLGRGNFYFDAFLFLFVLVPLRGVAAVARFVDWAIIDTLASGGPASLFESAASFFGPLQYRGVFFYLFSALLGTVVLSVLLIWLQN
jgi:NADH:ubiquinone oxidoreductase subunit 5 (subunit L)/multisubunit Na+/H+ antiporter MnhA subunit